MSEPLYTQTKLDVQLEAMAIMVREASRYNDGKGGARIGLDTSRKIAYNFYEYMRQEGMIIQPGYGYVKKTRKTRSDKGKSRKKKGKRNVRRKKDKNKPAS